jgi:hypothetical protein
MNKSNLRQTSTASRPTRPYYALQQYEAECNLDHPYTNK